VCTIICAHSVTNDCPRVVELSTLVSIAGSPWDSQVVDRGDAELLPIEDDEHLLISTAGITCLGWTSLGGRCVNLVVVLQANHV
jgi:hypothetical protein